MTWLNRAVLCWNLWFTSVSLAAASCQDTGWFCWIHKNTGRCEQSSDYAVNKCKKTCNFCPVPTVIPATTGLSHITLPTTPPKPKCFGRTLNLPISQEKFQDRKLLGHVIWKQFALSELQCEDFCLRVPGCLAYNYHYSAGKEQKTCELMNEVADIKDTPGYCFRLFERQRALSVLLGSCLGET